MSLRAKSFGYKVYLPRMLDQTLLSLFASQLRPWIGTESIVIAAREHVRILDAVLDGNGTRAELVMRKHVCRSAAEVVGLPDEASD